MSDKVEESQAAVVTALHAVLAGGAAVTDGLAGRGVAGDGVAAHLLRVAAGGRGHLLQFKNEFSATIRDNMQCDRGLRLKEGVCFSVEKQ